MFSFFKFFFPFFFGRYFWMVRTKIWRAFVKFSKNAEIVEKDNPLMTGKRFVQGYVSSWKLGSLRGNLPGLSFHQWLRLHMNGEFQLLRLYTVYTCIILYI